jgi:hypothetical protein
MFTKIIEAILAIIFYPVWLLWRLHERDVLSRAAGPVLCDGGLDREQAVTTETEQR